MAYVPGNTAAGGLLDPTFTWHWNGVGHFNEPAAVTYSFVTSSLAPFSEAQSPFNSTQQTTAAQAMQAWANVAK